jgi:hypothetical protein
MCCQSARCVIADDHLNITSDRSTQNSSMDPHDGMMSVSPLPEVMESRRFLCFAALN